MGFTKAHAPSKKTPDYWERNYHMRDVPRIILHYKRSPKRLPTDFPERTAWEKIENTLHSASIPERHQATLALRVVRDGLTLHRLQYESNSTSLSNNVLDEVKLLNLFVFHVPETSLKRWTSAMKLGYAADKCIYTSRQNISKTFSHKQC